MQGVANTTQSSYLTPAQDYRFLEIFPGPNYAGSRALPDRGNVGQKLGEPVREAVHSLSAGDASPG